jgi:hypothetical protein
MQAQRLNHKGHKMKIPPKLLSGRDKKKEKLFIVDYPITTGTTILIISAFEKPISSRTS